ncbi:MAG TPA: PKD domain-containing protein [Gaiellaceae bacterium]|nr:PKD domain-containing protein [Gaiellaceae bacterium]
MTFVLVGTLVAAAGASAPVPPKWLTAHDVSDASADAITPHIAVDDSGTAIAVWPQVKNSVWTAQAVERPAGGAWSAPQQLSEPASQVEAPQIAVGGSTTVAVWLRNNGKNLIVQAAERSAKSGSWSPAASLSLNGQDALLPSVAVDSRGDAVVVWASVALSVGWTAQAAYKPAGGAWSQAVPLDKPQAAVGTTDVGIDAAGNATCVWSSTTGVGWRVHAAHGGPNRSWSRDVAISAVDPRTVIAPRVVVEGTGGATAVWSRTTGRRTSIEMATRRPGTSLWLPVKRLFPTGPGGFLPQIAVDGRGDGVLLWLTAGQAGDALVTATRRPGGRWSPPLPLPSGVVGASNPEVALDAQGDAVAVWTQQVGGTQRVLGANLPVGGSSWSTPRALSKLGGDATTPQVALDGAGDGAATWARSEGGTFVVQIAGFDAVGPALLGLTMPSSGTVGQRLTFSVSPQDVWSSVQRIRWSFGDGSTGSGKLTGHTYRQSGRYPVEVTATDSVGHVSTARRVIAIAG